MQQAVLQCTPCMNTVCYLPPTSLCTTPILPDCMLGFYVYMSYLSFYVHCGDGLSDICGDTCLVIRGVRRPSLSVGILSQDDDVMK